MRTRALAMLLTSLAVGACSGPLANGDAAFDEARYADALSAYRLVRPARLGAEGRLTYALRRGLAHLALGDVRAALDWLTPVKRRWDRDPYALDAEQQAQLLAAWQSMGLHVGEAPPRLSASPAPPRAVASPRSEPQPGAR